MEQVITFASLWRNAKAKLQGHWCIAISTCVVFTLIMSVASRLPMGNIVNFLLAPLSFGLTLFFIRLDRCENVCLTLLFGPFRDYGHFLWAYLRPAIFVILWTFCLIIPGIIAGFRYWLTSCIVLDYPEMPVKDAMTLSCRMMYGYKLKLFGYSLLLTLIGTLFGIVTLGIGLIWYLPFVYEFYAGFYNMVKAEKCPDQATEMNPEPDAEIQ